jgi:copper chaperone CopZ
MIHTFKVTGMTCAACEYKIKHLFSQIPGVTDVIASKDTSTATIETDKPISLGQLKDALQNSDKYNVSEIKTVVEIGQSNAENIDKSWWQIYKPILLIFGYITAVCLLIQYTHGQWNSMDFMRHFMAGFFLVFSFFKLLNLNGFAESYQMYDIIAMRWKPWAYIYAFMELGLGFAYLIDCCPLITNITTLVVMSISIIGVLKTVLNKQKIQCACLGAIIDLPMSTVTIIEDGLMILMSGWMLLSI